jgi:hypothetical protein
VEAGSACDLATQSGCSPAVTVSSCNGQYTTTCACQSDGAGYATWDCGAAPVPDCADAQPPSCPPSYSILAGGTCTAPSNVQCPSQIGMYDCSGDFLGDAQCQCLGGAWSCPIPTPVCDAGPGPCPDPTSVAQGAFCSSEGQQCPGNPTDCGGQILYDAFQCTGGQWDDIATTICDLDGGGAG